MSGDVLHGTTSEGGALGLGTVFKLGLSAPIPLTAQAPGNTIVLSWSNPACALQAATEGAGSDTNITDAISPYTSAVSGSQMFLRLVRN